MGKQGGYNLLELVLVVTVISILAAAGAVYYGRVMDDARRTGVEVLAHRFTAAVALIHGKWILEYSTRIKSGSTTSYRLEVEGLEMFLNAHGWPANTDGQSTAVGNQTAEECYQVWNAVLQNPALATVEGRSSGDADDPQAKGRQRYHISQIDGRICRYELLTQPMGTHYFDYNLRTGQVKINVPPLA